MYSVHSVVYVVQYHHSQASPAPDFDHKLANDEKLGADQRSKPGDRGLRVRLVPYDLLFTTTYYEV